MLGCSHGGWQSRRNLPTLETLRLRYAFLLSWFHLRVRASPSYMIAHRKVTSLAMLRYPRLFSLHGGMKL